MPTREQIRRLLDEGLSYEEAAGRLGIPAGLAYMIVTGMPADGGDSPPAGAAGRGLLPASQHLANPPHENPATSKLVRDWIAARVAADPQMRAAARH
jgi:hypothetical protein